MTSEAMKSEVSYQASIAPFKHLLKSGAISSEDYSKIDTILTNKYRPVFVEYMLHIVVDKTSVQR